MVTLEQVESILVRDKVIEDPLEWVGKPNNSAFRRCVVPVLDDSGVTIPGLSFVMERRTSQVVDECKDTFSLFWRHQGVLNRIFQLEVLPREKRASRQNGVWIYGPHLHINDHEDVFEVHAPALGCRDHPQWLELFALFARIDVKIPSTVELELLP